MGILRFRWFTLQRGKIEDFTMQIDFLRPACARLLSPGYKGKCMNDKTWQVQIKNFEPDRDILLQVPQD